MIDQDKSVAWLLFPGEYIASPTTAHEPIGSLFLTPTNELWALVGERLMVYAQEHWRQVRKPSAPIGRFIWYRDHLWAGGISLVVYDEGHWRLTHDKISSVSSLAIDADFLWVGTWSSGLWRTADGHIWEQIPLPKQEMSIGALWSDTAGVLWVSEVGRGAVSRPIYRWDGENWDILPLPPKPRAFHDIVTLITDEAGRLWAGSGTGGGVWGWAAGRWTHFAGTTTADRKPGLPGGSVSDLFVDSLQRVWAITHAGIGCYDTGVWRLARTMPPPDRLFEIWGSALGGHHLDRHGRLWTGTYLGDIGWIDTTRMPYTHPMRHVLEHNGRLVSTPA